MRLKQSAPVLVTRHDISMYTKACTLVLHCLFQEGDADIRMQLSEEDKQLCAQVVKHYLSGKVSDPVSAGG